MPVAITASPSAESVPVVVVNAVIAHGGEAVLVAVGPDGVHARQALRKVGKHRRAGDLRCMPCLLPGNLGAVGSQDCSVLRGVPQELGTNICFVDSSKPFHHVLGPKYLYIGEAWSCMR